MKPETACPLLGQQNYCRADCPLGDKGCKILGDYLSEVKQAWIDPTWRTDTEQQKMVAEKIATRAIERSHKRNRQLKEILSACSAAEDDVLLDHFDKFLTTGSRNQAESFFTYLYHKYVPYIHATARNNIKPPHDDCTCEEIEMRVMVSLSRNNFRSLLRFDGRNGSAFQTYLNTIIKRRIADCLRENRVKEKDKKIPDKSDNRSPSEEKKSPEHDWDAKDSVDGQRKPRRGSLPDGYGWEGGGRRGTRYSADPYRHPL